MRIINALEIFVAIQFYDKKAVKKAANLSVNSDLLTKARDLKINLSRTLENALKDELRKIEQAKWKKENLKAIESLNELSEKNGLFSDKYRVF